MSNSEVVEQDTIRNAIAECLGKISQFDPSTYIPKLQSQLSSSSSHTRSTVLIAIRHTFIDVLGQQEDIDAVLTPTFQNFIQFIGDSDQVLILSLTKDCEKGSTIACNLCHS